MSAYLHLTDDLRVACPRCDWVAPFTEDPGDKLVEVFITIGLHAMKAHAAEDLAAEAEAITREATP